MIKDKQQQKQNINLQNEEMKNLQLINQELINKYNKYEKDMEKIFLGTKVNENKLMSQMALMQNSLDLLNNVKEENMKSEEIIKDLTYQIKSLTVSLL